MNYFIFDSELHDICSTSILSTLSLKVHERSINYLCLLRHEVEYNKDTLYTYDLLFNEINALNK